MNSFRLTCLIPLVCISMLIIGCSETGDPVEPELPGPTELLGTVGAGGGTLTSSDGLLSITIPPGALDRDTGIALGEIELSEVDPAFGDGARAALLLEPEDLSLSVPAQITYSMSIIPQTGVLARKLPADDEFVAADFIMGATVTLDGVKVPNQRTDYILKKGAAKNVTTTVEVEEGGQIVYAGPLDQLKSFGQFATLFGPEDLEPTFLGIPKSCVAELKLPDLTKLELGDIYFKSDPEADLVDPQKDDWAPWEAGDTTILDNDYIKCPFEVDMVPLQEGSVDAGAIMGGNIVWFDPTLSGIPLGETPDIGDLEFTIIMPIYSMFAEVLVADDLTIQTGMTGLKDLAVAFGTIDDPAPLGEPYHSWLFVVGSEGVRYYRLVETGGKITSTQYLEWIDGLDYQGVVPLSTENATGMKRSLFVYGTSGWMTSWNEISGEYGMMGGYSLDPVYDAVGYGGKAHTPGMSYARGYGAYFVEYSSEYDIYTHPPVSGGPLFGNLFPGDGGPIVSVFVDEDTQCALIIKDGLPGEIWFHARFDLELEGMRIGTTGSEPKQMRGAGGFYAISNYISNTLTTFTWYGAAGISNVSSTPVGLGPEGIDVILLGDATPLVVSTGSDTDYTLSHFSISGSHLKSVAYDAPASCSGPRHAVFAGRDPNLYVILSCHDSGTVEIIPVDLADFE